MCSIIYNRIILIRNQSIFSSGNLLNDLTNCQSTSVVVAIWIISMESRLDEELIESRGDKMVDLARE